MKTGHSASFFMFFSFVQILKHSQKPGTASLFTAEALKEASTDNSKFGLKYESSLTAPGSGKFTIIHASDAKGTVKDAAATSIAQNEFMVLKYEKYSPDGVYSVSGTLALKAKTAAAIAKPKEVDWTTVTDDKGNVLTMHGPGLPKEGVTMTFNAKDGAIKFTDTTAGQVSSTELAGFTDSTKCITVAYDKGGKKAVQLYVNVATAGPSSHVDLLTILFGPKAAIPTT